MYNTNSVYLLNKALGGGVIIGGNPNPITSWIIAIPPARFPLSNIINIDEVPILFEFLDGYIYDFIGTASIDRKTERSGWAKRQAILVIVINTEGRLPFYPKIIFRALEIGRI